MPPKNKGKSKKPAKARTPTLIDGLTKEEMSKEQLEEHIVHLREELDREREERNYFQLERDKIHTFWKITERQIEEVKAEHKNLEKEMEEDERRHQVELKVYKQKMKHLLCEHQNTIAELKADGLVSAEVMQKEQKEVEAELAKGIEAIMVDTQGLDHENLVKDLELKHEREMAETREALEKQLAEIESKFELKLKLHRQELDNMSKKEIKEREDHWNSHIAALIEDHKKAMSDFDELNNQLQKDVDQNNEMKKNIADMKVSQKEKEKELVHVMQHNKHLKELLLKVEKEIADKEKKMISYGPKKDFTEKRKLKQLHDLKSDHEELKEKFRKLQWERDELYRTFTENIQKAQQKTGEKSVLLERKVKALTDRLQSTQAQFDSVLSAANMDQTALSEVNKKIEEDLDSSNNSIKNLRSKKALIAQARKDLLLTFEAKQRALGVSVD